MIQSLGPKVDVAQKRADPPPCGLPFSGTVSYFVLEDSLFEEPLMRDGIEVAFNVEVDELMVAAGKVFLHFAKGVLATVVGTRSC